MTLHVEGPVLVSRLRKCFSLFLAVLFLFLTILFLTCCLVLIYSHCCPFLTPSRGVAINVFLVPIKAYNLNISSLVSWDHISALILKYDDKIKN